MNHTKCPICTKDVSFPGLNKHLFSAAHADDLKNALFKRKATIITFAKIKPVSICFKSQSKNYYLCYPCKHLSTTLKPHDCSKAEENLKIIKELLNKMTEPTVKEEDEFISTKEVDALKKRVDHLQSIADRALDAEDALSDILSKIKDQDFESFKSHMTNIKLSYPELFQKVYSSLGGEEGREDEFEVSEGEVG